MATALGVATTQLQSQGEVPGLAADRARSSALSWDDYFMSVAFLTAMRSKDPSTQVGACIVNPLHRIIGIGYNGFPSGIPDHELPWAKSSPKGELHTKYPYVVHAELNAVLNKNAENCRGCRLYSTLFPCNECAKVIIQAGITRVIYASDKHHGKDSTRASRDMFRLAGVETRQHSSGAASLQLALRYPEDEPLPEPHGALPEATAAGGPPTPTKCRQCECACSPPRPLRRRLLRGRGEEWEDPPSWPGGCPDPRPPAAGRGGLAALASDARVPWLCLAAVVAVGVARR